MVALSQRVDAIPCAHDLEAAVRELRLIAEHKPRYNRRSRFPERALWVRLTEEPFPRLSVVRRVRPGTGVFLGPFPDRRAADAAVAAVHESLPLRQCTGADLPARPRQRLRARRDGPVRGAVHRRAVGRRVRRRRRGVPGGGRPRPRALVAPLLARVDRLSAEERYEDAAVLRDRVAVLVRAVRRRQRLESLAAVAELAIARPDGCGGLAPVRRPPGPARRGRAAPRRPRRSGDTLAGLLLTAETPTGPDDELAASVDETELVLRWMEKPGTRLVEVDRDAGLPRAGHRGLQRVPRPRRGRPHRPRPVRRRPVPGHPRPARAGDGRGGRPRH